MRHDRDWGIRNVLTGKAGECAVASQLFLRNMPVMFSMVDLGVDLVAHNGCRIQVKSAHLCVTEKMLEKTGHGVYSFPLLRTKRRSITKDRSVLVARLAFADVCDVVVFWGIEENRFWVVPANLADRSTGLNLGAPDPTNRFVGDLSVMREMLSSGSSYCAVGRKYGLSVTGIKQLLKKPGKNFQDPSITSQVRQCENAWDHILNFTAPDIVRGEVLQFAPTDVREA